jgi:hypothetical protein
VTHNFQSNELSFPAIAKFWWEWRAAPYWFNVWDTGMPLENTYFPLVPWLIAFIHGSAGMDFVHAYHLLLGLSFAASPLFVFLLARRLTQSTPASAIGTALYVFISTSAAVFPEIRSDLGSMFYSRRIYAIAFYGEGPHIFSLAFLPLAMFAFSGLGARGSGLGARGSGLGASLACQQLLCSGMQPLRRHRTSAGAGCLVPTTPKIDLVGCGAIRAPGRFPPTGSTRHHLPPLPNLRW